MARWALRHPFVTCMGTVLLLATTVAWVVWAVLPGEPSDGCLMGPDCVVSPRDHFEFMAILLFLPALFCVLCVGALLGLMLRKPFLRRAARMTSVAPDPSPTTGPIPGVP
jgi:hypothetical protein